MVALSFFVILSNKVSANNLHNHNFDGGQRRALARDHMAAVEHAVIAAHAGVDMQAALADQAHGVAQFHRESSLIGSTVTSAQLGIVLFQIIVAGLFQAADHGDPAILNVLFLQDLGTAFAHVGAGQDTGQDDAADPAFRLCNSNFFFAHN